MPVGNFQGTISGQSRSIYRSGVLDSTFRFSVNLMGGPAMQPKEFVKWKQRRLLGVSLKVIAPTGQYSGTKLINWGGNRRAFKPELDYSERGVTGCSMVMRGRGSTRRTLHSMTARLFWPDSASPDAALYECIGSGPLLSLLTVHLKTDSP
jgi:hypothetical protein